MHKPFISSPIVSSHIEEGFSLKPLYWMLSAGITFRITSAATTFVLAYILSTVDYGELMTGIFWALFISLVATSGLSELIVSNSPPGSQENIPDKLNHYWMISLVLGVCTITLVYLAAVWHTISIEGVKFYWLCGTAFLVTAFTSISQGALRAVGRIILQARIMMFTALLVNSGLIALALWSGKIVTLGIWYLVSSIMVLLCYLYALKYYDLLRLGRFDHQLMRSSLYSAVPFSMVPMLMLLLPTLSSTIMIELMGSSMVGSYNLYLAIFFAAVSVSMILDQVFYPLLVKAGSQRSSVAVAYGLVALYLSIPAILIFGVYGREVADILLPAKYAQLDEFVQLLGILIPVRFAAHVFTVLLRLRQRQVYALIAYLMSLSILLVYWYVQNDHAAELPSAFSLVSLFVLAEAVALFVVMSCSIGSFHLSKLINGGALLLIITLLSSGVALACIWFDLASYQVMILSLITYVGLAYVFQFIEFVRFACLNSVAQ